MIINHIVNLESFINENSDEPAVKMILAMSDEERQQFFQKAGEGILNNFMDQINEGCTWAELRIKKTADVAH